MLQHLVAIQTNEFEQCFRQWKHRLDKCIKLNGEYIEGVKGCFVKSNKIQVFIEKFRLFLGTPSYIYETLVALNLSGTDRKKYI